MYNRLRHFSLELLRSELNFFVTCKIRDARFDVKERFFHRINCIYDYFPSDCLQEKYLSVRIKRLISLKSNVSPKSVNLVNLHSAHSHGNICISTTCLHLQPF